MPPKKWQNNTKTSFYNCITIYNEKAVHWLRFLCKNREERLNAFPLLSFVRESSYVKRLITGFNGNQKGLSVFKWEFQVFTRFRKSGDVVFFDKTFQIEQKVLLGCRPICRRAYVFFFGFNIFRFVHKRFSLDMIYSFVAHRSMALLYPLYGWIASNIQLKSG